MKTQMRPPTVFVEKKIKLSKLRTSWVFNQSLGSALQGHSKLLCFHSRGSPVLLWWDEDRCFTGTHQASACWGENRVFTSTLPSSCSYGIFILAIRSENWSWLFLCLSVRVISFVPASSASPKLGHVSYTCVLRTEKDSSVPPPSLPSPSMSFPVNPDLWKTGLRELSNLPLFKSSLFSTLLQNPLLISSLSVKLTGYEFSFRGHCSHDAQVLKTHVSFHPQVLTFKWKENSYSCSFIMTVRRRLF